MHLMQAINQNKGRIKVYGWLNGGFDVSTSNKGDYANAPAAYYVNPNRVIPDQQVLYIERLPDTLQTDHVDWGFRFAQLYGQDYRYTTAKGIFSQQLLARNHEYGYDPVMFYLDVYFPHVAKGMNIRMGRYISLPDIEAQLAPNNYTYSHSILYTIDPYTQTGIVATIKLSDHWLVQGGFSGGNDVAPRTKDATPPAQPASTTRGTKTKAATPSTPAPTPLTRASTPPTTFRVTTKPGITNLTPPGIPTPKPGTCTSAKCPAFAPGVINPIATETGANGTFCAYGKQRCFAPEVAIVNYVEKELNHKNYLSFRNEFVDDIRGQRTGYATKYSEHLISYGHLDRVSYPIRPEIRLEHSYSLAAYDLGTKKIQFVVAGDLTYHF